MGQSRDVDDLTSIGDEVSTLDGRLQDGGNSIISRMFHSCEDDARGSVHRTWGLSVLCMILFFVFAMLEANKLREDASACLTLQIAAYYTAGIHFLLLILGTFVLKRFATAFTVGCFLGFTLILSQQNLLMFAAFFQYDHGDVYYNSIFAYLALALFLMLGYFTLILGHFKDKIIDY